MAVELLKVFAWIPLLVHLLKNVSNELRHWCFAVVAGLLLDLNLFRHVSFMIKECLRFLSNIGLCYLVPNLVEKKRQIWN